MMRDTPYLLRKYIHRSSRAWWHTPVIPALGKLRQEKHKFGDGLGYIARHYLKKSKINKIKYMYDIPREKVITYSAHII
jgi:hypothetical protein